MSGRNYLKITWHALYFQLLLLAILRFFQRKSMGFYFERSAGDTKRPIRVHPILLSLEKTIDASETDPDISTISENDARAVGSGYYTSPSALPPLEIHISGQNGPSLLSNQKWLFPHVVSRLPRMHGACCP
jgi:hypothetical protein